MIVDVRAIVDGRPSHISEDKSQQKKRARGHQPPPETSEILQLLTVCKSNHRDNIMPPSRIWYGTTRTREREFSSEKFVDYSCGDCDALYRIVNSLNKYVSQFAANMFSSFFFKSIFSNRPFRFALD